VRARHAGFTLIEVLVALAIVTIGMAAVLESLSSSANTVSYLRDKTLSEWVGLNQIATARLNLQPGQVPMTGNTQGDIDYAGRSWHWRQEVSETQVKGIVRIDVKVRPAQSKAGDDNGWFVTVSGIAGDALAAMQGTTPTWGTGGAPCVPGQPDCNQSPNNCQPGNLGCTQTPTNCTAGQLGCSNQNSGNLGGNSNNTGGLGGARNNTGGLGNTGSTGQNPTPPPQNPEPEQ
jgi:general secretion pathway protein I